MKTLPPSSRSCLNCKHPLTKDALYCPQCSQKNTDGKIPIRSFLGDTFEAIFNFDSKIFRTLRDLFIPGKLTEEYFKGRHKSYLHPVRFFLLVTLTLVTLLNSAVNTDREETPFGRWQRTLKQHQFIQNADTVRTELGVDFPNAKPALDSFYTRLAAVDTSYQDSIPVTILFESINIAKLDIIQLADDELVEAYLPDVNFWKRLTTKQMIKIARKGHNIVPYVIDRLSWAIIIAIPFFAFFLKLLYRKQGLYYMEHLVFLLHIHIFLFSILILLDITGDYLAFSGFSSLILLLLSLYILFAMKRIYQQIWAKTLVKYSIAAMVYWFTVLIGIMLAAILSFFLF